MPDYWKIPVTDPRYQVIYGRSCSALGRGGFDSPAMLTDIAPKYSDTRMSLSFFGTPAAAMPGDWKRRNW